MGQIISVFPISTEVLLPQEGIPSPQGQLGIERLEMARHEPQLCNSCRKDPFCNAFSFHAWKRPEKPIQTCSVNTGTDWTWTKV